MAETWWQQLKITTALSPNDPNTWLICELQRTLFPQVNSELPAEFKNCPLRTQQGPLHCFHQERGESLSPLYCSGGKEFSPSSNVSKHNEISLSFSLPFAFKAQYSHSEKSLENESNGRLFKNLEWISMLESI